MTVIPCLLDMYGYRSNNVTSVNVACDMFALDEQVVTCTYANLHSFR